MSFATKIAEKGHTIRATCGDFSFSLMKAERLVGDRVHGLPPGEPVPVWPVASIPGCPDDWIREDGSYVCPVHPEWGLWFSFCACDSLNTAIVPSVKGMNPITGLPLENLDMIQHKECPKHKKPFAHGTFCEECGYKWAPQNYIAHPNTLWWDGFAHADGTVRQFFFTAEQERDIASVVMGKENTVPAFGFAFYETIKKRVPNYRNVLRGMGISHNSFAKYAFEPCTSRSMSYNASPTLSYDSSSDHRPMESVYLAEPVEEVSVGAGAKISQDLKKDPLDLDKWKKKPSALIRLYFVFENQFKSIVDKGGIKDLNGDPEGWMSGMPVG